MSVLLHVFFVFCIYFLYFLVNQPSAGLNCTMLEGSTTLHCTDRPQMICWNVKFDSPLCLSIQPQPHTQKITFILVSVLSSALVEILGVSHMQDLFVFLSCPSWYLMGLYLQNTVSLKPEELGSYNFGRMCIPLHVSHTACLVSHVIIHVAHISVTCIMLCVTCHVFTVKGLCYWLVFLVYFKSAMFNKKKYFFSVHHCAFELD